MHAGKICCNTHSYSRHISKACLVGRLFTIVESLWAVNNFEWHWGWREDAVFKQWHWPSFTCYKTRSRAIDKYRVWAELSSLEAPTFSVTAKGLSRAQSEMQTMDGTRHICLSPFLGPLGVHMGFCKSSAGKESACNAGDPHSIPGWGRSAGEGIGYPLQCSWSSLVLQLVKNPPAMWETWVWSLGGEYPPEKGKATHSSFLAWRISRTI